MSTADFARNSDNFCYRHPDRVSFVMCQRCLRTVCHECQTQGATGVVCPECMKQQKANRTPAQKKAERRWGSGGAVRSTLMRSGTPATTVIIAVTVLAYLVAQIFSPQVQLALLYFTPAIEIQPWRLLTVVLTHGSFLHLALNMLAVWMIGRALEPAIGTTRFVALYVVSALGGDAAVSLLQPGTPVVGASGAIFGLMAAYIVIARRLGNDVTSMLVILGLNFAYGMFLVSGISWQAHLGGAVFGALAGLVLFYTRERSKRGQQIAGLIALALVATALAYVPFYLYR